LRIFGCTGINWLFKRFAIHGAAPKGAKTKMFDMFKRKGAPPPTPSPPRKGFPPVPAWQPWFNQPILAIIEAMKFYTNRTKDLAIFANGTIAVLPDGLTESQAKAHALEALNKVLFAHPDMNPMPMKDGNILIQYSHDIVTLVLKDVSESRFAEIDREYRRAIVDQEVMITPLGQNEFDDFGKKALFGRCFMFMDAQKPEILQIARCAG
jgi:hypothetical protein